MEAKTVPPAPVVPAPRKRWRKALLIAGASLAGLILLAVLLVPPIVASVAKSKIPEILGPMFDADVTVGDVSFGWSGRLAIEDLRIAPRGFASPMAEVKKTDAKISLGSAIGGSYLVDVEVVAPKIVVEKNAQGRFNYDVPPQPTPPDAQKEKPPSGPSEPPFVQAVLRIRDGEVTLKGPGKDTVFKALTVDAKVDTLSKPIDYSLSLADPGGGTIRAEGSFDLDRKAGPAKATLERLALENLAGAARAYGPDPAMELGGRLQGSLDYRLDGLPAFTGKTDLALESVALRFQGRRYELDGLRLTHAGGLDAKGSGPNAVTLDLGPLLTVDVKADLTDALGARAVKTTLKVDSDLTAVEAFLGKGGMLSAGLKLAGQVSLTGSIDSQGPADADLAAPKLRLPVSWDMETRGKGIAVTLDGKRIDVGAIRHAHKGSIDAEGTAASTLVLDSGKVASVEIVSTAKDVFGKPSAVSRIDAKCDLGELGKMLEKLLDLKEGMALEGKAWLKGTVEAQGADAARVDLDLGATDLVAIDKDKKRQEVDKAVALRAKGAWDGAKKSVDLETFTLVSAVATADAKGGVTLSEPVSVRQSSLQAKADLEKLGARLSLFMADPPGLAGTVDVKGSYAGEKYELDTTVRGVKITTRKIVKEAGKDVVKPSVIGPIDATVTQKGTFSTAKNGGLKIEACRIDSSAVEAAVTGEVRNVLEADRAGDLVLAATVKPVELSKWMPDLGLGGPPIELSTAVSLKPELVTATGKTELKGLLVKDAGTGATKIAMTKPIEFTVVMKGKDRDLSAKLKTAFFEWVDQGYAAKGALESDVTYTSKGTGGTSKIVNLEIVDGQKNKVVEPAVTLVHDVGMSPGAYDLRKVEIASGFLSGSLTGAVKNLDTEPEFVKVKGSFRYHPDRLGAALKPWLPGTPAGAEWKALELSLDGKAKKMDVLSILRGATSTVDLDLAKFTMTGATVSGRTRLDLKDGRMVSGTPLEVNQGKTDLNASLDFREPAQKPVSRIVFQSKDVDANANMGPLLENINPIFHTVNGTLDGKLTSDFQLLWSGPIDPDEKDWVKASKASLTGQGVFAVRNLNVVGSPTVKDLMAALGEANAIQGELLGTEIRVANGRCEYTNMTLRMARYELRFTGWVDFGERDRQGNVRKRMEMMVEMPMTPHLQKKYPPLARYLGKTFFVPLKGTVDSPRLDFEAAIQELIKRALPGLIEDKAKDLLDRLLDRNKKK